MQFKDSKVVLFRGVVDLRKGAAGLVALVDNPEPHTWYLFSNRSRTLMKCVRLDRSGAWMGSRRLKQGHYRWLDRITYHIPGLDEKQQDQIYVVLLRSSKAYTPEMQIATGDDVSNDNSSLDSEQRPAAIEQILQPHQKSDWATYRNREQLLSGVGQ